MKLIPPGFSLFREDLESIAVALDSQLIDLDGAKIFISGGTGFFGIWLLESLIWINETRGINLEIFVLTRDSKTFLTKRAPHMIGRRGIFFVEGSITKFNPPAAKLTHIIHAASEPNLKQSKNWAQEHLTASIEGTKNLLNMAAKHQIKAMLTVSSGAVYSQTDSIIEGMSKEGQDDLNDYLSERMVYGQSKRIMELMTAVSANKYGFNASIARCFCFVGPYLPLDANYAIGNFIRDALSNKTITINGDGTPIRSYLYPTDLVIWLITILNKGKSGRPYNVGGDFAISIADLAKLVSARSGNEVGIDIKKSSTGGVKNFYLPDLKRSKYELGLNISVDLLLAIDKTFAWIRAK